MNRQILKSDPTVSFNLLVSFCEKTNKKFELISKSEETIDLKIFFGDAWSGKKILKCKLIKSNQSETELYLTAAAMNPLTGGELPIPLLQQKSVEKYLTEIVNFLNNANYKPTNNSSLSESTRESKNEQMDSLNALVDLDKNEKNKNKMMFKFALIAVLIILAGIYFIKDSNKYSICECQPLIGRSTLFKDLEDKYSWCNRKYSNYTQERLIGECAEEIRKNTFTY